VSTDGDRHPHKSSMKINVKRLCSTKMTFQYEGRGNNVESIRLSKWTLFIVTMSAIIPRLQ
jgi:hypothetical protein